MSPVRFPGSSISRVGVVFMVLLLLQRIPVGGAALVTGQLPLSPRCFLVAGKLACSAADGALSTRRARSGKFPEEISDEGAPQGNSRTAGPDEGGARQGGADASHPKDSNHKTSKT